MIRIVSLIASATEIVHALGLGQAQVGRSHECDFPEEVRTLPVCTTPSFPVNGDSAEIDAQVKQRLASALSVYEVFENVLEQLQPTHIITQTQCRVCAVTPEDVERALARSISSRPKLIALEPNALDDIWKDINRVAFACGVADKGEDVVTTLRHQMLQISTRAGSAGRRPRVACIEWHEPLMAAGNWVPELVELANGENLFGKAGLHSPWMNWGELVASDPDVIISMPCGFDLGRTRQEMYWLTDRPEWRELRAVRSGEVYLADGNQYLNRPGPRIVESLEILAEILHPAQFEPKIEGVGWERFQQTN
ncbi:MAG TPA: cobalamin-binding protein [Bryobacteraceae bacterium]|jgi:iron complex transport system substrate-binding protein|nr:cobalamin-binding protein [Bryobacteraceae bacterium]